MIAGLMVTASFIHEMKGHLLDDYIVLRTQATKIEATKKYNLCRILNQVYIQNKCSEVNKDQKEVNNMSSQTGYPKERL